MLAEVKAGARVTEGGAARIVGTIRKDERELSARGHRPLVDRRDNLPLVLNTADTKDTKQEEFSVSFVSFVFSTRRESASRS
jgi:hypothetical protein